MVRSDMTTSGKPKTHRSAVSDVHESDVEARWWAVSCFGIDGEMPLHTKRYPVNGRRVQYRASAIQTREVIELTRKSDWDVEFKFPLLNWYLVRVEVTL